MSEQSEHDDTPQPDDREPRRDRRTGRNAAAVRMQHQASWVDQQIRVAMAKGEFDDLPGRGQPIRDLGSQHDPDWWVKRLVEREQITGVLPPSLQLRKEDAELDARLDRLAVESEVTTRARRLQRAGHPGPLLPRRGPAAGHDAARGRRRRGRLAGPAAGTTRPAGGAAVGGGPRSHRHDPTIALVAAAGALRARRRG